MMVVKHEAHLGLSGTFTAAAEKGAAVKVSGVRSFAPVASGTEQAVGVSFFDAAVGEFKAVQVKGDVIPMNANAAIAAGALVELAANGRVVTKSAGLTFGVAWTSSTGAGQKIEIIVL